MGFIRNKGLLSFLVRELSLQWEWFLTMTMNLRRGEGVTSGQGDPNPGWSSYSSEASGFLDPDSIPESQKQEPWSTVEERNTRCLRPLSRSFCGGRRCGHLMQEDLFFCFYLKHFVCFI